MVDKRILDLFFALLRAGLWEQGVCISPYEPIDFDALYDLADEQSVVGLIAAGLEHVEDRKVVKKEALPFLKKVFGLEGRNSAMNSFIEQLVGRLQSKGITVYLVKGQGIAQCYERPLWRSSGDIDLLFDECGYEQAKAELTPIASSIEKEDRDKLHLGMTIDSWPVELHGTLRNLKLTRVSRIIDEVQKDSFQTKRSRIWRDGNTDILLPSVDNDVIFVFAHILQHFFSGGVGLRQICDWCRLLWTYRDSIDRNLLESRILRMGVRSEWNAFAAYAVAYLGMPVEAMPFYDLSQCWQEKANGINSFILKVGNMGHNRDRSIYDKYPYVVYKAISLWRKVKDFFMNITIFPKDVAIVFFRKLVIGVKAVLKGE